jgi:hypothetical protein
VTEHAAREVDLDLTVAEFGISKSLLATSEQMPNLMVTGADDAELWGSLGPVITSLFEAKGERVSYLSLDRSKGPRTIRVHAGLSQISDR